MSDLIRTPQVFDSKNCPANTISQKILGRTATIGEGITIRRFLPHAERKTIGAWCFLDHFGPIDLKTNELDIGPHPHIGLQTFTYPLAGEILHRDSLGSKQVIQPGQVNIMTAGKGISHSEESLPDSVLHGVQLWIALPDAVRHMEPDFFHHASLPSTEQQGLRIHLLVGDFLEMHSDVKVYSPLVGVEVQALENSTAVLPLNPEFEYGILPLTGNIAIENQSFDLDTLLYLGCGHTSLPFRIEKGTRFLIIGGEPFKEEILIWWNFVARTKEEMIQAAQAWTQHSAFGEVKGYEGSELTPPMIRN